VEVRVRCHEPNLRRELIGKHVYRGIPLREGRKLLLSGLNHALDIVSHQLLGERVISVTVVAGAEDYTRLMGRGDRWRPA